MRVIRGTYGDAVAWRLRRHVAQEARDAGHGMSDRAVLEPAVVVSGPDEHADGTGVLVEAVGPDGTTIYRRLIPLETARPEDALEGAIQEAWRRLVRHVGASDGGEESMP